MNDQVENDIKEIIEHFDWLRVHTTMHSLEWSWASAAGVPCVEGLKNKATELLLYAVKKVQQSSKKKCRFMTSTGGFEAAAQKFKDSDKIYMELKFVVTSEGNYE